MKLVRPTASIAVLLGATLLLPSASANGQANRVDRGLLVLYDFTDGSGRTIHDRSGVGTPMNLSVENDKGLRWSKDALSIESSVLIASPQPARKIIDAVKKSNAITIETWLKPASGSQTGPARVVSLSADTSQRNVTLGQDNDLYDVRLRATGSDNNGLPSTASPRKSLQTRLTHVVFTRDPAGAAMIYVDGKRVVSRKVNGNFRNWDSRHRLTLANELTKDRPWLGELHLVAVYDRALSARDVQQNFAAGTGEGSPPPAERLAAASATGQANRVDRGLLVLYDFAEGSGSEIHDRSGIGAPMNLSIKNANGVVWSKGGLSIRSSVLIASPQPARKIIDAVKTTNAITIEAWLKPASASQTGPARIVSISADTSQRNITLGQDNDFYDVRLRATGSDNNGLPSTASPGKSSQTRLTHVVFTRDSAGSAIIYVDGKQVVTKKVSGNFGNWDSRHRLTLANELTQDRPWLGELQLVAVYDRALPVRDVQQNFAAGSSAGSIPPAERAAAMRLAQQRQTFDTHIAPLFAKHCLECHDSAIKKGDLDLSRKVAALAGGESGTVITPGNSADSLLWEAVSSNEMPKDRAPLSSEEKAALRQWLDAGAVWTTEVIDPVIYVHGGHAGEVWVQRLTVPEYIETVRSAIGVDIAKEAHELLPPDLRADGFRNTAYNLNIDLKHVEAYARLAEIIVERMDVLEFAARFSKSRKLSTDDTMREHVAAMGKWLLRGPLDQREVDNYSGIATTIASAGGDFQQATSYIIEAMLQSPRFIYRIENQQGGGSLRPAGPYELASRLSYILWGAPPDQELMRAADGGELADRGKVAAQVQRMLKDPRAVQRSSQFVSEWLNLSRLDNMRPDVKTFPKWDPQLASDMREETLAFFREVAWKQNRPLSDLLNAQLTYATPRLAEHYGLKPAGNGLTRYDLSSLPSRGGLLTQGSVLTVGGDGASMVSRGLFVLHDLLRGTVNAPPPCVNTTPPPTKVGLTQRGIAQQRIANVNCGVCHARFEPLAFGLEKFDGVGAFHDRDQHGNALRDDGEILFPTEAQPVTYQSSAELMNLLAGSERVRESLTWKVTQFALGRPLLAADAPLVAEIHKSAQQSGGTYSKLITAIVMSDLVQKTRTENER